MERANRANQFEKNQNSLDQAIVAIKNLNIFKLFIRKRLAKIKFSARANQATNFEKNPSAL